jgi:hypothetical protein
MLPTAKAGLGSPVLLVPSRLRAFSESEKPLLPEGHLTQVHRDNKALLLGTSYRTVGAAQGARSPAQGLLARFPLTGESITGLSPC